MLLATILTLAVSHPFAGAAWLPKGATVIEVQPIPKSAPRHGRSCSG